METAALWARRQQNLLLPIERRALQLFVVLQGRTARRRNFSPVGHQAMSHLIPVRNELAANRLRVLHTGILVILRLIGLGGDGRKSQAEQTERKKSTDSHYKPLILHQLFFAMTASR
jgi:hypothetical protein